MRIWDISPKKLCRQHLLAEHRELHGLWNILTIHKISGGYSNHPETKRWVGKEAALYKRHENLVEAMSERGFLHNSHLDKSLAKGENRQDYLLNTQHEQEILLRNKNCECLLING